MKLLKTNICLTSRVSLLTITALLVSTLVIASVYRTTLVIEDVIEEEVEVWIPTVEDIAFQDSMYAIIERTQLDLDTIRSGIDRILYNIKESRVGIMN